MARQGAKVVNWTKPDRIVGGNPPGFKRFELGMARAINEIEGYRRGGILYQVLDNEILLDYKT